MSQLQSSLGRRASSSGPRSKDAGADAAARAPPGARRARDTIVRSEQRYWPSSEERRVDFRRREIHEAWLVQHREHGGLLRATERAGRGPGEVAGHSGAAAAVVGRARQPERRARGGDAERGRPRSPSHHDRSPSSGVSSNAPLFFGPQPALPPFARFFHRAIPAPARPASCRGDPGGSTRAPLRGGSVNAPRSRRRATSSGG